MERVYLSVSNQANREDADFIEKEISKRAQVVRGSSVFAGHGDMLSCDFLLILPGEPRGTHSDESYTRIGRGQKEQIDKWLDAYNDDKKTNRVLIVNEINYDKAGSPDAVLISETGTDFKDNSPNDFNSYTSIYDDDDMWDLDTTFGEVNELATATFISGSTNLLLVAAYRSGLI